MKEIILNVIFLIAGVLIVVFHKPYARFIIKHQNKSWGFHFADKENKISGLIAIIVGIGFVAFSLFNLIHLV